MEINEYVEKYQPILQRTFSNALKTNKIPHAFLLSGLPGVPLKELALYIAKSLLCDNPNPLADLTCNICKRIDNGDYPDLAIFDGAEESIKKEQVEEIINAFSKTALEKKGIMIYIIHLVETMNDESVNALLKFLEEPVEGTYAILTTENDSKVLPTIISRCETIRLLLRNKEEVKNEAISLGIEVLDAEILCNFINDPQLINNKTKEKEYKLVKEAFISFINALPDFQAARYEIENIGINNIKGKPSLRLFFDMVSIFLSDILNASKGNEVKLSTFADIISKLTNLPHIENSLKDIMVLRRKVETNINTGLLLIHMCDIISR